MGRVFAHGPGHRGSSPGRVIQKTLKMVLDTSLLTLRKYKVRIKGKAEQSKERSSALHTSQSSSYWKGSLQVALDYGHQLYLNAKAIVYSLVSLFNGILTFVGYLIPKPSFSNVLLFNP